MGFVSQHNLLEAVNSIMFKHDDNSCKDNMLRTHGFWHVLIALRHLRLTNDSIVRSFVLSQSYDLAEACFDINGIYLPVESTSREVYFEPAATSGKGPSDYFRHREGPRQTYANRIYTGLGGNGPRQPKLFDLSGSSLPVTVALNKDWVKSLRANPVHKYILDDKITEFIAFIFRFGIPSINNKTGSIAKHNGQGSLSLRNSISFLPIPANPAQLKASIADFFGLITSEFDELLPYYDKIDLSFFDQDNPVDFELLGNILKGEYLTRNSSQTIKEPDFTNSKINWDNITNDLESSSKFIGGREVVQKCISALKSGKNIILLGPPGCGKTLLAKEICEIASDNGIKGYSITTATSEWSTFETLGGYMPASDDPKKLEFRFGVISSSINDDKWLIIDEFNRADIDKAFGELFTLLSGHKIMLPFVISNKPVNVLPAHVPADDTCHNVVMSNNWRLIGTMNTFDKSSLYQMSYALMRRFAFIDVTMPDTASFYNIINNKLQILEAMKLETSFIDYTVSSLIKLFCSDCIDGLADIKMQLGPAIANDILDYIASRINGWDKDTIENDGWTVVLEALEMYLYPQFEGRDLYHNKITDIIYSCINKPDKLTKLSISDQLSLWTGYEEGN